jgi:F-type H+-transporting ATPase subunit b
MMLTSQSRTRLLRSIAGISVLFFFLVLAAFSQSSGSGGSGASSSSTEAKQGQEAKESPKKQEAGAEKDRGFGEQLARETREAAGEGDDTAQFRQSPSVVWLSKLTGGNLQHAYWLAVLLNFAVIAGVMFWAGRKYLPGMFRNRTLAIQKAMEEARKASEDANRRLSEIESRLSRLDEEIASMTANAEKDVAAEEARIKAAAEVDARKIVESAEQEIEAAAKAARRDLTTYAADLAISLAKKQIHVDPGTDSSLVRSFADRLGSAEDGGKN